MIGSFIRSYVVTMLIIDFLELSFAFIYISQIFLLTYAKYLEIL